MKYRNDLKGSKRIKRLRAWWGQHSIETALAGSLGTGVLALILCM